MNPGKRARAIGPLRPSSWAGLGLGISLFGADQVQRSYVAHHFYPHRAVPILGLNWLRLTRVPNSGMMFQFREMVFRPENALYVRCLPAAALVVLLVLFALLRRSAAQGSARGWLTLLDLGFALLWCGGVSNVYSHWRAIFIDDTFAVRFWPRTPFYIFDLADVGVLAGVILVAGFVFTAVAREPT
jgi:lipoprotein signal peptidase